MTVLLDRPGLSERVSAAIRLAGQAKLDEAELLLREALMRAPNDAWALNALGGIALSRSDAATAFRLIAAAATIRPDEPEILANLAGVHAQLGRSDEALICLDRAVERAPEHAAIRRVRAEFLLSQSRAEEAAAEAQRALELEPDDPAAWVARGLAAIAMGDAAMAFACLREAAALDQGCVEAWHNLAELHARQGESGEALACAERAYLAAPGNPAQIVAFARRLADHDPDEAQALVKRARALAPDFLPAAELAARLALARGEDGTAFADLATLVRRSSGRDPASLLMLARILATAGRFAQALQSVAQVLSLAPDNLEARMLRNECLFALGRFDEAWAQAGDAPRPVAGVIIPAEMPIGETLLAARFLPRLARGRERPLPVAAHPDVAALLDGLAGISLVGDGLPAPEQCLLLPEIMAHLRIDAAAIAVDGPYLVPDPDRLETWRRALAALPGPRIGILWHGGSRGIGLAPVLETVRPLGTPVSLAVSDLRHELELDPSVIDGGCRIAGPQDLAAAIAALDAVVVPDSLAAHLAGALGRPAIVFVPAGRHWAWADEAGLSRWYPSIGVLAQAKPGDWTDVRTALPQRTADLLGRKDARPRADG